MPHQEEVGGEGEAKGGAFDHHEADDPPPGEAARTELAGWKLGDILGEARLEHQSITGSGWRARSLGQNQAVSAIAQGTIPTAIAHGEKIEATNTIPIAMAEMNGHRL